MPTIAPSESTKKTKKNKSKSNNGFLDVKALESLTPEQLKAEQEKLERIYNQATVYNNKIAELLDADTKTVIEGDNFEDEVLEDLPEEITPEPTVEAIPVEAPAIVEQPTEINPFAVDHQYADLADTAVQTAFTNPANENEKVIKQMLEDRVAVLADEKMKALPVENWKKAPWYKKPFSFAKGVITNLTSSATYNETKNQILYKNGVSGELSADAVKFYKQLHESIHFAEQSGGTEKQLLDTLKGKALSNSSKAPRSRLVQKFLDSGLGRNLSARFGRDGSFNVKADSASTTALAVSGTTALGLITTAAAGITRGLFKAVPIIGSGIAAGIFGGVYETKKQKSLKAFVESHLSHTVFAGISAYPTFNEVKEKLQKSKNPYFELKLAEAVLDRAMKDGRQDREAGMMGLTSFLAYIKTLRKDFEQSNIREVAELNTQLLNEKKNSINTQILTDTKAKVRKSAFIASIVGTGLAGILMGGNEMLTTKVGATPTSSLEAVKTNAMAKASQTATSNTNHSVISSPEGTENLSEGIVRSISDANHISEEYIDGYTTIGNVQYVVLKANDGGNNYPIYALPNGQIPYHIASVEAGVRVDSQMLAQNTQELRMPLGNTVLRPTLVSSKDTPIEVQIVSADTIRNKYNGEASTFFKNGKRVIVCTPEYANEELFHAAFGISKEPHSHTSSFLAGTKGHVDGGEQALINEKRQAILNTTNSNAEQIKGTDIRFASPIEDIKDPSIDAVIRKERVLQMYNDLNAMRARLGNPEATKAAIVTAKMDLERYQNMHVSESTLKMAGGFYENDQPGADKLAKLFGSFGSENTVRNNAGGHVGNLVSKGYKVEQFDEYDDAMVGLDKDFENNGEYFFNEYTSRLEADPSPKAKELLLNAYEEKLSNLKKMDYAKGIGRETERAFIDFDPPTVNNVNLYRNDILAEELRIKAKIVQINDDLELAKINKKQLEEYVQNLERQYSRELADEASYNAKLAYFNHEQALAVKSQQIAENLKTGSELPTAQAPILNDSTNGGSSNAGNPVDTTRQPNFNQKYTFDPLTELRRSNQNHTGIERQQFYNDFSGRKSNMSLDQYMFKLDKNSNGREVLNTLINKYFTGNQTPAEKSANVINYLESFINRKTDGAFQQGFTPRDSMEVGEIRINGYKLADIMNNETLKGKLDQSIVDIYSNANNPEEIINITEEEEYVIYDPKTSNWVMANWMPDGVKKFYSNDPYYLATIGTWVAGAAAVGLGVWNLRRLYGRWWTPTPAQEQALIDFNIANAAFGTAKTTLQTAKVALATAQGASPLVAADVITAQNNLDNAKEAFAKAKSKLSSAKWSARRKFVKIP